MKNKDEKKKTTKKADSDGFIEKEDTVSFEYTDKKGAIIVINRKLKFKGGFLYIEGLQGRRSHTLTKKAIIQAISAKLKVQEEKGIGIFAESDEAKAWKPKEKKEEGLGLDVPEEQAKKEAKNRYVVPKTEDKSEVETETATKSIDNKIDDMKDTQGDFEKDVDEGAEKAKEILETRQEAKPVGIESPKEHLKGKNGGKHKEKFMVEIGSAPNNTRRFLVQANDETDAVFRCIEAINNKHDSVGLRNKSDNQILSYCTVRVHKFDMIVL